MERATTGWHLNTISDQAGEITHPEATARVEEPHAETLPDYG